MSQFQPPISKWQPSQIERCYFYLKKTKKAYSADQIAKILDINLLTSRKMMSNLLKSNQVKIELCECCGIGRKYRAI